MALWDCRGLRGLLERGDTQEKTALQEVPVRGEPQVMLAPLEREGPLEPPGPRESREGMVA